MNFSVPAACSKSTAAQPAPELVEVFVNDKQVFVEPGTTVLQVSVTYQQRALYGTRDRIATIQYCQLAGDHGSRNHCGTGQYCRQTGVYGSRNLFGSAMCCQETGVY